MVTHDIEHNRFIIDDPKGLCYLEYEKRGSTYVVLHTVVPKALEGQGLAGQLATAFYDWISKNHLSMQSECSYMTAWMKRKKFI